MGENFCTRLGRPWGSPILLYNWYFSLFLGFRGRGVALTTHLHLAPMLENEFTYQSTSPLGLHCPIYLNITLYHVLLHTLVLHVLSFVSRL